MNNKNELLNHLNLLHTTPLGIMRIKRNLLLEVEDVIAWCKTKILNEDSLIYRNGKNWYVESGHIIMTVHATSYTLITAHTKSEH